jgi:hypothetical protein
VHDALLALSQWLESTPWGIAIRGSSWMFPIIEWIHLSGLSVGLATSVIVDLRLLGVGKSRPTAAELSDGVLVWNWIGLGVAISGGFLMFSADATTYMSNAGFRWKLGILSPAALLWHVVVQNKASAWAPVEGTSAMGKLAGSIELLLWLSIVTASVYFLLTNAVTHP